MRDAALIVFFDIPVETSLQQKQYRNLTHFLTKDGYIRIQKSVFAKRITNISTANLDIARLKQVQIDKGDISMLVTNYKYFRNLVQIKGKGIDISFFEKKVIFY